MHYRITLVLATTLFLSSCSSVCNVTLGPIFGANVCITKFHDASFGAGLTTKELSVLRSQLIEGLRNDYLLSEEGTGSGLVFCLSVFNPSLQPASDFNFDSGNSPWAKNRLNLDMIRR